MAKYCEMRFVVGTVQISPKMRLFEIDAVLINFAQNMNFLSLTQKSEINISLDNRGIVCYYGTVLNMY